MSWQESAACRDHPHPEWWFPEKDDPPRNTRAAKQVCAGCPVKADCLADAPVEFGGRYGGIWGGLTGPQRANVVRRRAARVATPLVCVVCAGEFPDTANTTQAKYCSMSCGERARYRRKKGRPIADDAQPGRGTAA